MESASENISNVVAILTAIISEQEDLAYAMVLESNPIELFSAITGVLLSCLHHLTQVTGVTTEEYLKDLGMLAFRTQ